MRIGRDLNNFEVCQAHADMATSTNRMNGLFKVEEVVTKNFIGQFRLIHTQFFSGSSNLFAVVILYHNGFERFGEGPKTDVAIQRATLTCGTFGVVTLFTEGLPVVVIIAAASGSRDSVIRRKLDCRLPLAAVGTHIIGCSLGRAPMRFIRLGARLALWSCIQRDKLVFCPLFDDTCESFVALKFSHAPEWVTIWLLSCNHACVINKHSYIFFADLRARNAMSFRPKAVQQQTINVLQRISRRHEVIDRLYEPIGANICIRNRCNLRLQQKSFTSPRFIH